MTDEMLALARTHAPTVAANLRYPQSNVEFKKGHAEAMPVDNDTIDLIVSNCVINLAPDKSKVFEEMFRILRPGGRFTISDIVADQPIPRYLLDDKEKWGDCLSGALQIREYANGLRDAGFLGIHQIGFIPWRVIDGIHFLSLTFTGYKLAETPATDSSTFATLAGPFSQVTDERGRTYVRGTPELLDARTSTLLHTPGYQPYFLFSDTPIGLTPSHPRWQAIMPEEAPCAWKGHFAVLTGPFMEAHDDDAHSFHMGTPLEICSKTLKVLQHEHYQPAFAIMNRSGETVSAETGECQPTSGCC